MRMKSIYVSLLVFLLSRTIHAEPTAGSLQSSNLLNPNISVIGWIQAEAGHRAPTTDSTPSMQLKEAEIAYQAVVDPFSRADVFLSANEEGLEVEEGYLTWFHLPGNLGLKVGKFKANLGKFNRTHTPETAFADRPLIHEALFGEEGLSGTGASVAWDIPNPLFYTQLNIDAFSSPTGSSEEAFQLAEEKNLTYVGRINTYFDLTEASNVTWGVSEAWGQAGEYLDVDNSSHTLHTRVSGVDVTYRWKNPRRAIYRSLFWQTELFRTVRDLSPESRETSVGFFSHLEYQFARQWRSGVRWDYAPSPVDKHAVDKGGLLYLTFYPSEFNAISIQGRRVRKSTGEDETLGWLKITFNIGPHGAHPF